MTRSYRIGSRGDFPPEIVNTRRHWKNVSAESLNCNEGLLHENHLRSPAKSVVLCSSDIFWEKAMAPHS